jgi:hypothetical protein
MSSRLVWCPRVCLRSALPASDLNLDELEPVPLAGCEAVGQHFEKEPRPLVGALDLTLARVGFAILQTLGRTCS